MNISSNNVYYNTYYIIWKHPFNNIANFLKKYNKIIIQIFTKFNFC